MRNIDLNFQIKQMIDTQIKRRGISDRRLLQAIRSVPRHLFIPEEYQLHAYNDCPLPIGFGQTISQPFIVAFMVSKLHLNGNEKVLEIGTGSGYQAAILSHMASRIISVEIIHELAERAEQTIFRLGIKNINIIRGDGSMGCSKEAPYNAIIISSAAPMVPAPLFQQLAEDGKMIIPVGSRGFQRLEIWIRSGSKFLKEESIPVTFVPLCGEYGWKLE